MRKIDTLVVHCTDHPDTSFGTGVAEIRRDHVAAPPNGRGWDDVGYHYVVRRNGEIECGRMESVKGAHCPPVNERSIGVAWVGRYAPSSQQRRSMVRLLRELVGRYGIERARLLGHKEADPNSGKACPVISMDDLRAEVFVQ